jgi:Domain of unknown function (DUF3560)
LEGQQVNDYEAKQEARRERLLERAEAKRREAEGHHRTADRMSSVIPFGQPILVGHHSEKSDRRYRARIHGHMSKWIELDSYAKELERRAESIGRAGISSDDPEAIDKLKAKVARLEAMQEKMKQANMAIRAKNDEDLKTLGFDDAQITKLKQPDFLGRVGFPDYALTNNGANIRRIKHRIEQLEKAGQAEAKEIRGKGYRIEESPEENRIMFIFDAKPADGIRQLLKSNGFRWSPTRGAWVRFLNGAGWVAANYVSQKLKEIDNGC